MANHDTISADQESAIRSDFLKGMSIRMVAARHRICEKSAALRRKALKDSGAVFPSCGCGRSTSHTGMCAYRVREFSTRAPVEPANLARFHKGSFRLSGFAEIAEPTPEELISAIDAALPRRFPLIVRQEARQEMLLALLDSSLRLGEVADRAHEFIREIYRQYPEIGAPVSLDDEGDDGRPLSEALSTSVWEWV